MSDLPRTGPATFADLQAATGIPRKRLYAAIDAGTVPALKIGKRIYTRHEWITAFCATGTWTPATIERTPDAVRAEEI